MADAKYGRRNVAKMIKQVEVLRTAIRAEGTPAIQVAWDAVEEHIDYAYRAPDPALSARVAELEAALKPFADAADEADDYGEYDNSQAPIDCGQCRDARAALKAGAA